MEVILVFLYGSKLCKILISFNWCCISNWCISGILPSLCAFLNWYFYDKSGTGISALKYCTEKLLITQLSRQKASSDDLRWVMWLPKLSKLSSLNRIGPLLLPTKAWQQWHAEWYILRLWAFLRVKDLRIHKKILIKRQSGTESYLDVPKKQSSRFNTPRLLTLGTFPSSEVAHCNCLHSRDFHLFCDYKTFYFLLLLRNQSPLPNCHSVIQ